MTENNPHSPKMTSDCHSPGSRSSPQGTFNLIPKLYKGGASVIFEYESGLLAYDCEWIKLNSYGADGSVSFLTNKVAILTWADKSKFIIEIEDYDEYLEDTVYFKDTLYSVYFTQRIIQPWQDEGQSTHSVGISFVKTYYANLK